MARPDTGTHTPESLTTVAAALQAIAERLHRAAEAMKEKSVATLEIKNQAGLKAGITALRSFGMAAEEALEETLFDHNVFKDGPANGESTPKARSETPGPGRRKKQAQPESPPEVEPEG
jgi:predicted transcriptional regulator